MGTRSVIGVENDDGTVTYIYVHFDGYVEYIGTVLITHYSTIERVQKLMMIGSCHSIGLDGVPKPIGDFCKKAKTISSFIHDNEYKHIEYYYLFVNNEKRQWTVYTADIHPFDISKSSHNKEKIDLDSILDENIEKTRENIIEIIKDKLRSLIYDEMSDKISEHFFDDDKNETIVTNIIQKMVDDYGEINELENLLNPMIAWIKEYVYDEDIGFPELYKD